MKKHFYCILAVISLVIAMTICTSATGYGTLGDNINWGIDNSGTLYISGNGEMSELTSEKDYPWYEYSDAITGIFIQEGVTSIGSFAFFDCDNVKTVTIPVSLKKINAGAFSPKGGRNVYISDLTAWCNIDFIVELEENEAIWLKLIDSSNPLYGYGKLYLNGQPVSELIIPEGTEKISAAAFYYCDSIVSAIIPSSVKVIENGAFANCSFLSKVTIENGVEKIGAEAFQSCPLRKINIPASVSAIGDKYSNAFSRCIYLEKFNVNEENAFFTNDEYGVLYNKNMTVLMQYPIGNKSQSYEIPEGVTEIANEAFSYCRLASLHIPISLKKFGYSDFESRNFRTSEYSPKFNSVYIKDISAYCNIDFDSSFQSKGIDLYLNGIPAEYIKIPGETKYIKDDVFNDIKNIKSIIIDEGVIAIGHNFENCPNLKDVALPQSLKFNNFRSIDTNCTFYGYSGTETEEYIKGYGYPFISNGTVSEWKNPFTDIKDTDYFFDSIKKVNRNGLMNGMYDTVFSPSDTLTRAMFVTILYRIAGEPEVEKSPFSDISVGSWYEKSVAWAYENGIVNGTSETTFSPEENISIEQMLIMAYRFADSKKANLAENSNISWSEEVLSYEEVFGPLEPGTGYALRSYEEEIALGIRVEYNAENRYGKIVSDYAVPCLSFIFQRLDSNGYFKNNIKDFTKDATRGDAAYVSAALYQVLLEDFVY